MEKHMSGRTINSSFMAVRELESAILQNCTKGEKGINIHICGSPIQQTRVVLHHFDWELPIEEQDFSSATKSIVHLYYCPHCERKPLEGIDQGASGWVITKWE